MSGSHDKWLDEILWFLLCPVFSATGRGVTSTGETPFSLTYGTEAVIPVEIGMPTQRMLSEKDNDRILKENLDLLEERREIVAIREAKYKKQIEKYYNKRVKEHTFRKGDYVLRCNEVSRVQSTRKLGPRWEGPYIIQRVAGKGAYVLQTVGGLPIARTWNGVHLRKCYL
ncbi:hypothetical protein QVD17_10154 [Tagetes erecta]|uniref:Reverse transcriptase domain-containing protein n=1 Tax=Tagetes erecta TaxID=13708 RepID=A0AAD8NZ85_TARER|nr:hypothetical protein QVD17_10154 [Tagetes erecta]